MILPRLKILYKKQKPFFFFLYLLLLFIFPVFIWQNFQVALDSISNTFGYADYHHHWRVLDDFTNFKMPFIDYSHRASYGWFYLLLQSIPYSIFNRTFFALLVVRHLFLPFVGVALSYLVARNVLKKPYLITFFLFFCLLSKVNYVYESPRHLVAELSLSFLILFFLNNKTKYLFISGVVAGLSIMTSFEYGTALNVTILLVFIINLFFSKKETVRLFLNKFLPGEAAVLIPYFTWLYIKGVLDSYWEYTSTSIVHFYYFSPASSSSFPRLSDIKNLAATSKLLILGLPIEFLQKLNLYFIFAFFVAYATALFFFSIRKKGLDKKNLTRLSLILFGLAVFIRTLDTPAIDYFTYGLVPFFLLLTLVIEDVIRWSRQKKSSVVKILSVLGIASTFLWFILTGYAGFPIAILQKEEKLPTIETGQKEFYPPVGWFIKKDLAKQYGEISNYVTENTNKKDFLYVYPWGPYNHLTGLRSPSSSPLPGLLDKDKIVDELQSRKPKFIVVNIYNNSGVAHYGKKRTDVIRYYSLESEDGPVFSGEGSVIQKYILENYEPVLKNDLAILMKPRTESINIKPKKKLVYTQQPGKEGVELQAMETKDDNNYKILGRNASWTLVLKNPIETLDVAMEFKLDGDLITKRLSRYFINLQAFNENEERLGEASVLAKKAWQTDKIHFNQSGWVKKVRFEIARNTGLVWWFSPYSLKIGRINFYR